MRTQRRFLLKCFAAVMLAGSLHAQAPVGSWNFTAGDLNGEVGLPLEYQTGSSGTAFGTTSGFGIPDINGVPAPVMRVSSGNHGGYRMRVPLGPNGGAGAAFVNDYTVIMDVLYPEASNDLRRPLLETDQGEFDIASGAEFYVSASNQLGGLNNLLGMIAPNVWQRVGIVVEGSANQARLFIDGQELGSFPVGGLDGQLALIPNTIPNNFAVLFEDQGGQTVLGYVGSVQFRDRVLTRGEMQALGGASAEGIPLQLPAVPSFVEAWEPNAEYARYWSGLGVLLNPGSSELSDFALALNDNPLTLNVQPSGDLIRVTATGPAALTALSTLQSYTLRVTYTDSEAGQKQFSHEFYVPLLYEDFDLLVLGPNVDETSQGDEVWTADPPAGPTLDNGWVVDNSLMPTDAGNPVGMTEWRGWTFADVKWWPTVDDQRRSEFLLGRGAAAIADPDEWDDTGSPVRNYGYFNSYLETPTLPIAGVAANSMFLRFNSSWRPECCDDAGPDGIPSNNQTAVIEVSYDGGDWVQILKWDSQAGSPTFKPDATNERVILELSNAGGQSAVKFRFGLLDAGNDWWWAFDELVLDAGVTPPAILTQPTLTTVTEGQSGALSAVAGGGEPLSYQWFKRVGEDLVPVAGATADILSFNPVSLADDGFYTLRVSNPAGELFSNEARLLVLEAFGGDIAEGLVLHLTFDGNPDDISGRGNHGALVGQPEVADDLPVFVSEGQFIGTHALRIGAGQHVSLGQPADLLFGADIDFSFSFWLRGAAGAWTSDPPFVANKNWGSGGNQGFIVAAQGNGGWKTNIRGSDQPRRDTPNLGVITDGEWRHLATVWRRSGFAEFYVDGVQVGTMDISGMGDIDALDFNIGNDGTGRYGFANDTGARFVEVYFDDFGVWRRAINPEEVQAIYLAGLQGKDLSQAAIPEGIVAGQWDFETGDLSATVGGPMTYFDGAGGPTAQQTEFGTTESFGIPSIAGEVARVMRFPKNDPSMGYLAPVGGPNGGEGATKKNLHTLIFDILYPAATDGEWRSFIQIDNLLNANDGELFINRANGIGISGQYHGVILPDTWHRVVFVIDQTPEVNQMRKYIDGELVGAQSAGGFNGRWGLLEAVIFFADEDNETQSGFVSSIQVRNEALTGAEVAALGGASASGIPQIIEIGGQPPVIAAEPLGGYLSPGGSITLTVGAEGNIDGYRWYRNDTLIDGEAGPSLILAGVTASQAGVYRVEVFNDAGFVSSTEVMVEVFDGPIGEDLVLHLPFNGDAMDASGRENHGALVVQTEIEGGALPIFVTEGQLVGSHALRIGAGQHVNLGRPDDLLFGADASFSLSFWVKGDAGAWTSDPPFVGNKNWGSGSNPGFALAGRGAGWKANHRGPDADRQDANGPNSSVGLGVIADGGWHQVAAVYDRNGVASFYFDGQLVATLPLAGHGSLDALDFNIGNDGTGRYGFDNDTGARFVEVYFDDFGVWRRRLTAQEIEAVYQGGFAGLSLADVVVGVVPVSLSGAVSEDGSQLRLSWPGQQGWVLQRNTDAGNPAGWGDVEGTDSVDSVDLPINPAIAAEYFRLVQPVP